MWQSPQPPLPVSSLYLQIPLERGSGHLAWGSGCQGRGGWVQGLWHNTGGIEFSLLPQSSILRSLCLCGLLSAVLPAQSFLLRPPQFCLSVFNLSALIISRTEVYFYNLLFVKLCPMFLIL